MPNCQAFAFLFSFFPCRRHLFGRKGDIDEVGDSLCPFSLPFFFLPSMSCGACIPRRTSNAVPSLALLPLRHHLSVMILCFLRTCSCLCHLRANYNTAVCVAEFAFLFLLFSFTIIILSVAFVCTTTLCVCPFG